MASVLAVTKSQNTRILQLLLQGPTSKKDVIDALLYASQQGLSECVTCLLQSGVDANICDINGNSPLHLAVSGGHAQVVEVLCQGGAHVNAKGVSSNAPVHIASRWGKDQCLQVLIQHGCNINSRDSSQSTPLILAVKNKEYEALRMLLDAGCDVNAKDSAGRTALHFGSLSATAVEQLLQAGADVNTCDVDGCSPLLYAATEGLERVVSCLTQVQNCNVNLANNTARKTPLHILAYKGHHLSVRDLLEHGASLNVLDAELKTAMWYAVANGHLKVVQMLLLFTFSVESCQCSTFDNTYCPVQLAVDKGLSEILKLFIMACYDSHHMRECLHQPKAQALFSEATEWLSQGQVLTLQQACRKWIRHHLRTVTPSNTSRLPIPAKFINYILMKDLEEIYAV